MKALPLPTGARTAPRRGFTLAEVATACALAGVMATLAAPGLRTQQIIAGRLDAVDALAKVQIEQGRMYAQHGLYAADLNQLSGARATHSPQGRYAITLQAEGSAGYVATATPRADGQQAADRECPSLTLQVREGFAQFGPTARCWGR